MMAGWVWTGLNVEGMESSFCDEWALVYGEFLRIDLVDFK